MHFVVRGQFHSPLLHIVRDDAGAEMTANDGFVESADATLLSEYQHFLAGNWRINHCNY